MKHLKTILPLSAFVLLIGAAPAYAHGFGERTELPVPLGYFRLGNDILMGVRGNTLKLRNIEENPKVSLLLESGSVVSASYPMTWHLEIASALQANDVVLVKVKGVGEHSSDGQLERIVEPESITRCWAPAPNRLFDADVPDWETVVAVRSETE